jgi:hypothetical protein
VAGVIQLAFLGLALRRRLAAGPEPLEPLTTPVEPVRATATAERAEIVRWVAELDERYARGGLDESEYRAVRAEQKARLVALTRATASPS